jgi:hypothetical protein
MLVSDQKAVLLNTQGQVNLELEFHALFGPVDQVLANMFGYDKHVISLFCSNDQLVLYKDAKYWKTIKLPGAGRDLKQTHVYAEGKVSVLYQEGNKLVNLLIDIENEVADEKTFAGAGSDYQITKSHYKFE